MRPTYLGLVLLMACTGDSQKTDGIAVHESQVDAVPVHDRGLVDARPDARPDGPAPDGVGDLISDHATVDGQPGCTTPSCAVTPCGNCSCSWTCAGKAYLVTCDELGAAGMDCTCTVDQATVTTCSSQSHGVDVCSTQQCCGFPL